MRPGRALIVARSEAEAAGQTAVLVGWDSGARAVFAVADTVKPTSAEAVAALAGLGLRPILMTGDNEGTALAVANDGGIDRVFANVKRCLTPRAHPQHAA